MSFTKLDSGIVMSTVWQEPDHVLRVWITLLALSDARGRVKGSVPGLAHTAIKSVAETEEALGRLMAPDPYSRTKEHEGRRIETIDGGWVILNYTKYREARDPEARREYDRTRKRAVRAANVHQCPPVSANVRRDSAQAEAEAEAEPPPATPPPPAGGGTYLARCVLAVNRGLGANQKLAGVFSRLTVPDQEDAGHHAIVAWEADGIPVEVAETVLEELARQYRPKQGSRQPHSLRYFDRALREKAEGDSDLTLRARLAALDTQDDRRPREVTHG